MEQSPPTTLAASATGLDARGLDRAAPPVVSRRPRAVPTVVTDGSIRLTAGRPAPGTQNHSGAVGLHHEALERNSMYSSTSLVCPEKVAATEPSGAIKA